MKTDEGGHFAAEFPSLSLMLYERKMSNWLVVLRYESVTPNDCLLLSLRLALYCLKYDSSK